MAVAFAVLPSGSLGGLMVITGFLDRYWLPFAITSIEVITPLVTVGETSALIPDGPSGSATNAKGGLSSS